MPVAAWYDQSANQCCECECHDDVAVSHSLKHNADGARRSFPGSMGMEGSPTARKDNRMIG